MKPFYNLLVACVLLSTAGMAQVQTAGSYLDISSPGGGPIINGDILEIRGIISVPSGTTVTGLTYTSTVPANTVYIAGSMKAETNEGQILGTIPNTGSYTDVASDDRGTRSGSSITIYMGTGATSSAGGTVVGASTTPIFYTSASIIMAAYRVEVTGAVGSTLAIKGTFNYSVGGTPTTANLTTLTVGVLQYVGCSGFGSTNFMTNETNGTFGSGTAQNRAASSANVTGFTFIALNANQPPDGDYAIVKNTSPTQYTGASPAGSDRTFGVWDIIGDHSGTMTAAGNPPAASGASGGYMLAVNASYAPSSVFTTTMTGLTPLQEYTLSFWMYNLCSKCGANPASNSSTGLPGVKPNLAFAIGGIDYYNTGEITYTGQWVQYSLTFANGAGTSLPINIRNNAPGGGGNDWAIDDITFTTCLFVLPLKLVNFEGTQEPGGVVLNWQTESEENVSYFDVERGDGGNGYSSLGHVEASGQFAGGQYHFTDKTAPQGQVHYRLAIYDRDGKVSFSPIKIIETTNAMQDQQVVNIAPNPAIGNTSLYMIAASPGTVQVEMFNLAGSRVYSQSYSVSKGQNALPIRLTERLTKGMYIVRVLSGAQTANTKLLVE